MPSKILASLAAVLLTGSASASHLDVTTIPSDTWVKEPGIRLDLGPEDPPGTFGFHTPYVFRMPDGTLRMYYDAIGSGWIMSAVSTDGVNWTKENRRLVYGAAHPHVLEVPGGYRMYTEAGTIVATYFSTDGLNWRREPGARVYGVDPVAIELPDGGYRLYYRSGGILSAVSSDGLAFASEPGARVYGTEFAAIRLPDGTIILYYGDSSYGYNRIVSARSSDGLTFVADPGVRVVPGGPGTPDATNVLTTSILQFPDGTLRMYYQGSASGSINYGARVFSAVAVPAVVQVAVDVKPGSCPNPLSMRNGVLPAAILGTEDLDVARIDPASIRLEGVAPLRAALSDVAAPFSPFTGKADCDADCTTAGPDGFLDLTLKFDAQSVAAALGGAPGCFVARLTGNLLPEFGGTRIEGEDVVLMHGR